MSYTKAFFIIILFFPFYLFSQASEQPAVELSYGSNHEDHILELGEVDSYSFDGNAGDVIMIRMRDETKVDAFIKLYDPEGEMVSSAWSDGGLAKIRNFQLEKTGKYKILAYDRNHNDIGKYGISLHLLGQNTYAQPIPEVISFEDHIEEIVGVNMYSFSAKKGDVLFTQMRARTVHLECEFYIYNSKGQEVYKAINKGRLATVGPVVLDKNDQYNIVVTDRGGNDKDKFGMTHMLLNRHEVVESLTCGENKMNNLNKLVQRNAYRLRTRPGQIAMVEARSNNIVLETTMMIFDEEGEVVRQKSSTNKLISEILPVSAEERSYLVVVFDRNGNDFGDFGVQVQFLDNSFCPSILGCGSTELVTFDGLAQSKLFTLEGKKGETINVVMEETAPELEPHLRVYNKSGELIAEAYDGVKAKLTNQTFPEDGEYLVLASDRSGNDLGTFRLESVGTNNADLVATSSECTTVYNGYTEEYATTEISVEANGSNLTYLWSNGATSERIWVSPTESTEYSVTVTSPGGCSATASTFVEVINVSCGNGNGAPKVEVCHVKSNGQHQTKCISINGVDEHLYNGLGHEQCHLGPCDHVSPCDNAGLENIEVETRDFVSESKVFPNPTSEIMQIELGDDLMKEKVEIQLFNINGARVFSQKLAPPHDLFSINMQSLNIENGMYYLMIKSKDKLETKEIIYIK